MNRREGEAAGAAVQLDQLLERVRLDVGAHIGVTYLKVPERHVLQMSTVTGAPTWLARPWARLAMTAPAPAPEAVRTQRPVWIPDQQEMARRFPRVGLAFPYSVAMYLVPLVADGVSWGAILMMWPGKHHGLSTAERALIGEAANRMAEVLGGSAAQGRPVHPEDEPRVIDPPAGHDEPAVAMAERLTDGLVALDLRARMAFLTDKAARLLGRRDGAELLGAELWEALSWVNEQAHKDAFVAAVFSQKPTGFTARRPDGVWLSFMLYPDTTGVSVSVNRAHVPVDGEESTENAQPLAPARVGTLFHLLHLTSALTEAAGVKDVAESLMARLHRVLDAEARALLVADEGRLRVLGSRGFPPNVPTYFDGLSLAAETAGIRTMETGVAVFHSTNAELVRSFPPYEHYRQMAAFAFLPLTVSSGTFGYLVLGYDRPRPFTPDERAELTSLAGMIAQALERAWLYDANEQAAQGLQEGLLPRHLPQVSGIEIAARYRPAVRTLDVGG